MSEKSAEIEQSEGSASWGVMPERRPWVIVLLGLLFGAFVLVYCGRLRRAVGWYAFSWIVGFPIGLACMLYVPNGKLAFFGGMVLIVALIAAPIVDAITINKRERDVAWRPYQKWWGYLGVIVAFGIATELGLSVNRAYWVESFVLPTNGMKDTLVAGDRFMVDKLFFKADDVARSSVVIFHPPQAKQQIYVQRVIAVGGDTVEIKDDQVFLNGELLAESYAKFIGTVPPLENIQNYPSSVVPDGHVFLLGDNRWRSNDSRLTGMVPSEDLIGEARLIFWSREVIRAKPTRENLQGQETWGALRWNRIGTRIE